MLVWISSNRHYIAVPEMREEGLKYLMHLLIDCDAGFYKKFVLFHHDDDDWPTSHLVGFKQRFMKLVLYKEILLLEKHVCTGAISLHGEFRKNRSWCATIILISGHS